MLCRVPARCRLSMISGTFNRMDSLDPMGMVVRHKSTVVARVPQTNLAGKLLRPDPPIVPAPIDILPTTPLEEMTELEQIRHYYLGPILTHLPSLDNQALENEVFGPSSTFDVSTQDGLARSKYHAAYHIQRLEFVGDRIVNSIASDICFVLGPLQTMSPNTWISEKYLLVTNNAYLATLARQYSFAKRGRKSGMSESDLADAFEAYVAALCFAKGRAEARRFLSPLFYEKIMSTLRLDCLPPLESEQLGKVTIAKVIEPVKVKVNVVAKSLNVSTPSTYVPLVYKSILGAVDDGLSTTSTGLSEYVSFSSTSPSFATLSIPGQPLRFSPPLSNAMTRSNAVRELVLGAVAQKLIMIEPPPAPLKRAVLTSPGKGKRFEGKWSYLSYACSSIETVGDYLAFVKWNKAATRAPRFIGCEFTAVGSSHRAIMHWDQGSVFGTLQPNRSAARVALMEMCVEIGVILLQSSVTAVPLPLPAMISTPKDIAPHMVVVPDVITNEIDTSSLIPEQEKSNESTEVPSPIQVPNDAVTDSEENDAMIVAENSSEDILDDSVAEVREDNDDEGEDEIETLEANDLVYDALLEDLDSDVGVAVEVEADIVDESDQQSEEIEEEIEVEELEEGEEVQEHTIVNDGGIDDEAIGSSDGEPSSDVEGILTASELGATIETTEVEILSEEAGESLDEQVPERTEPPSLINRLARLNQSEEKKEESW